MIWLITFAVLLKLCAALWVLPKVFRPRVHLCWGCGRKTQYQTDYCRECTVPIHLR